MLRYTPGGSLLIAEARGAALVPMSVSSQVVAHLLTILRAPKHLGASDSRGLRSPSFATWSKGSALSACALFLLAPDEHHAEVISRGGYRVVVEPQSRRPVSALHQQPHDDRHPDTPATVQIDDSTHLRLLAPPNTPTARPLHLPLSSGVVFADSAEWMPVSLATRMPDSGFRTTCSEATLVPEDFDDDDTRAPDSDNRSAPAALEGRQADAAAVSPSAPDRSAVLDTCMPLVRLPGGRRVRIDHPVVIGRQPQGALYGGQQARELAVPSANNDISRRHVCLYSEGRHLLSVDLHTTNGTYLLRTGQAPTRLSPGEATLLVGGDRLDLGDGIVLEFEGLL
ncbi:FHA domain-containing protein [Pseudoclavibacter sp. 13-3]|uniref:FHA domain-containing protein n=1 Tax=Pseudoclavibacter sp. 13-3 TaxID=2901228 RepID=UPI001E5E5123|nr:FHA domain-containing protein [Pseudoclavibacter sp. 13-3]MCD7101877.1 FHA domain-containing protein [Pseudoclavibacter sp. 13-3]